VVPVPMDARVGSPPQAMHPGMAAMVAAQAAQLAQAAAARGLSGMFGGMHPALFGAMGMPANRAATAAMMAQLQMTPSQKQMAMQVTRVGVEDPHPPEPSFPPPQRPRALPMPSHPVQC